MEWEECVGIIPCTDSLVIYQRPQTTRRNGRRGIYGQSDGYFGKTVNPSEGVLELCKLDNERVEAVLGRTASIVTRVGSLRYIACLEISLLSPKEVPLNVGLEE